MAEQVQHPTTEELSASLDGQLSSQEQAHIGVHLQTCEQCQLELASLRQTVALLRALPQPALPRSFVLPIEKMPVSIGVLKATPKVASATTSTITSLKQRSNPWPGYIRTTTRVMSTLVAVLGIFILFSSLLMSIPLMRSTTTGAPAASNSSTGSAPQAPSAGDGSGKNLNGEPTQAPYSNTQATQTEHQAVTPTPSTDATTTVDSTDKASKGSPGGPEPDRVHVQHQVQPYSPFLSVQDFFDLSTPVGWMRLGLLLLVVGVLGRILLRPKKQASLSERP